MGKNFVQAMNRDTVVADRRLAVLQNTKRLRFFKDLFFIMETLLMTFTQSKVKFHSPPSSSNKTLYYKSKMKEVREIKEKIAFQFVSQILDQTFM